MKVALTGCPGYGKELRPAVEELLGHLGGIQAFVQPGQKVFIKPNMLTNRLPEQAVTTHPELVRVVIHLIREAGASPSVGDSPASAIKTEKVWEGTGFRQLCDEEKVPLVSLEEAGSVPFTHGDCAFSIAKPVLDADVVINMPKVKTHVLTILTAAMKNLYGTIPGYQKVMLHRNHPTPGDFGRIIAALNLHVKPALTIADGILGMEGDGPSAGTPIHLGVLSASADTVSMDLALCRLLGITERAVPYFRHVEDLKQTRMDLDLVGTGLEALKPDRFRVPGTLRSRLIPGWMIRLIRPFVWIRPAITDACIACGLCVDACPVAALSRDAGAPPVLAPKKCIGCCCCHEVCPAKAIDMTQSPLLNRVRRGRLP